MRKTPVRSHGGSIVLAADESGISASGNRALGRPPRGWGTPVRLSQRAQVGAFRRHATWLESPQGVQPGKGHVRRTYLQRSTRLAHANTVGVA
jgi:hypothetical protein